MNEAERIKAQQEVGQIEVKDFSGLSLKADQPNQPVSVWQVLDNFDLYTPSSIRKVLPPLRYNLRHFPPGVKILNFINYYAQPNASAGATLRVLGIGDDANIYDIRMGTLWASLQPIVGRHIDRMPSLDTLPNYFVPFSMTTWEAAFAFAVNDAILKYDADDGNLYVFAVTKVTGVSGAVEPTWEEGIDIIDGGVTWHSQGIPNSQRFLENALIVTVPGFRPIICIEWQYDPNDSEPLRVFVQTSGVFPPQIPTEINVVTVVKTLNGYTPSAGRAHSYTWYDPNTLHESSPAPISAQTKITETDNSNMTATIPGSLLPPLPADINGKTFESYQSYYIAISASSASDALAAGYEQLFVYETKDGGATFFRATQLFDDKGNLVTNSDGSISIAKALALSVAKGWTDYFPLPTPQAMQQSLRFYEGSGPANLVPDPENLGPESWTVRNGGNMVIVPGDSPQGNAAIEYNGTGIAATKNIIQSDKIRTTDGTNYYFQGFIDNSAGSGAGIVRWEVTSPDGIVHYLDLPKADGTAGTVSGSFLKPVDGYSHVRVRAHVENEIVAVGDILVFGDPLMEVGTVLSAVPVNYPTEDPALIIPAPAPLSQNQSPIALSSAIFQGCYFSIEQGTFRIWFSNSGDVQSVGANSFLPLDSSAGAPVLEILAGYSRLIVGKQKTIGQVSGTNQTDFQPNTIDPQHGVLAARSSIGLGSELISLLSVGISLLRLTPRIQQSSNDEGVSIGFGPEKIIGDIIKPLTDKILPATKNVLSNGMPCPAIDNTLNLYLFAFCTTPSGGSQGPMVRVTQDTMEVLVIGPSNPKYVAG